MQLLLSSVVGILGFFVLLILVYFYKSNKFVNGYLALLFFIVSVRSIASTADYDTIFSFLKINTAAINSLALAALPSLYLYFKNLINDFTKFKKNNILHFIFPILMFFYFKKGHQLVSSNYQDAAIAVCKLAVIVFILIYMTKTSIIYYKNFYAAQARAISDEHFSTIKSWLNFLFIIAVLASIRLLLVLGFETYSGIIFSGLSAFFVSSVLLLILFLKILLSPEILYGYPRLIKRITVFNEEKKINTAIWETATYMVTNKQESLLKNQINKKANLYIIAIDTFIEKEKPFRDANYSLNNLSNDLNIPCSHLGYIFKHHCKLSFVEYKNYYKIQDSIKLINDKFLESKTLDSLAYKVGFKSYNTFFVYFKKETNFPPKEYIGSMHKNISLEA